jgi:hypothetical protein
VDAPRATWNPARDVWEHPTSIDLLSEHSAVFSPTWPSSGMTRSGVAYPLPMLEPRTSASESSSSPGLPTPRASDSKGGVYPLTRPLHQDNLETRIVRLLPTPDAYSAERGGPQDPAKRKAGGHSVTLQDALTTLPPKKMLPTPRASEGAKGGPNQHGSKGDVTLSGTVGKMLPTPQVADLNGGHKNRSGARSDELLLPGVAAALAARPSKLLPTTTAKDAAASGGSVPSNVTLTDAIVREDLGRKPNPRHSTGESTPTLFDDGSF